MPINFSKVKLSVCMSVFNTAHLLKRSMETYLRQTMNKEEFELIICNDNSMDDVWSVVEPYMDKINIRYIHLRHNDGMRGGMQAFNIMYKMSYAEVVAEVTPEMLLNPNTFQMMYDLHFEEKDGIKHEIHNRFVTFKSYRLSQDVQVIIDDAAWKEDIYSILNLPGGDFEWIYQNANKTEFRTHEISSYRRKDFFNLFGEWGWVIHNDYGSCDPGFSGIREQNKWEDYVIMDFMQIHQWHPTWHWVASHFPQKYLNKWAHTIVNYSGDERTHPLGTACIWDGCSHEWYTEKDIAEHREMDQIVYATGYPKMS